MADYYDEYEEEGVEEGMENAEYEVPYYPPPDGALIDAEGRLLNAAQVENEWDIEDYNTFVSGWKDSWMAAPMEGQSSSAYVWPDIQEEVRLRRVDVFQLNYPKCQQATADREESRRVRSTPNWAPCYSLFFLNVETAFTKRLHVESTGPPRRHRFRLDGRTNSRDTSKWIYKETLFPYMGADRIPGTQEFGVDYQDSPDRYFLSDELTPELGLRRLYRFAAYPAVQYFILEKVMVHDSLQSEGGSGLTCRIERGPYCFTKKGWKIAGSFYAFEKELYGSNLYTVYEREDPFPLIQIAIGPIVRMEEWKIQAQFYAFDIPLPGSCTLTLQHCVRSIYSSSANVARHRLTVEDARLPWEFRMSIYAFPASLEDCSLTTEPVVDGKIKEDKV